MRRAHDPEKACPARDAGAVTGFLPARSPGFDTSSGLVLRRAKAGRTRSCAEGKRNRSGFARKKRERQRIAVVPVWL